MPAVAHRDPVHLTFRMNYVVIVLGLAALVCFIRAGVLVFQMFEERRKVARNRFRS